MTLRRSFLARARSLASIVALFFVVAGLAGCATPGAIGVQDFGTIQGRVVDARTNLPIGGAIASVGSLYTVKTDPSGVFQVMAPTGDQMLMIIANGYMQPAAITVTVVKNTVVNAGDGAIALQPVNP